MASFRKVPIPTLETERLRLRPLQRSDAPRIQALFSNPNLLRYMHTSIPFPYPENGAEEFLATILPKIEAGEQYAWAILRKDHPDEGMIGQIALIPGSDVNNRGFWLGEPYWRQGYMKEAVAAVNDFAFGPLEMEALLLNNAEPNLASHRVKEISGAEIIGREERPFIGGTFTSVKWKLTAEAWRANRENNP